MARADFSAASEAVLASHLGNRDVMLYSHIDRITHTAWGKDTVISRTVLRDMMLLTPRDPDAYLAGLRTSVETYDRQEALGFPGLAVLVLPKVKSQHQRAAQLRQSIHATELAVRVLDMEQIDLSSPLILHSPHKYSYMSQFQLLSPAMCRRDVISIDMQRDMDDLFWQAGSDGLVAISVPVFHDGENLHALAGVSFVMRAQGGYRHIPATQTNLPGAVETSARDLALRLMEGARHHRRSRGYG